MISLQQDNRYTNALATLSSKIGIPGEAIDVSIIYKTLRATTMDLILTDIIIDGQDWHVIRNLTWPSLTMVTRDLNVFTIVDSELYY